MLNGVRMSPNETYYAACNFSSCHVLIKLRRHDRSSSRVLSHGTQEYQHRSTCHLRLKRHNRYEEFMSGTQIIPNGFIISPYLVHLGIV